MEISGFEAGVGYFTIDLLQQTRGIVMRGSEAESRDEKKERGCFLIFQTGWLNCWERVFRIVKTS